MSKYQYGLFKYSELNELQTFLKINFKNLKSFQFIIIYIMIHIKYLFINH